jgi:hypothetical protein
MFNQTLDVSESIYAKLSCASDLVLEIYGSKTEENKFFWELFNSWGPMFEDLWFSGGIFIVFELSAVLSIIVIIITLTLLIFQKNYLHLNFCAAGCMWASHLIAIIGWLGINDVTFDDDCEDLTDGNSSPTLCVMTGPKLGIFVLIYSSVIMVPYFLVFIIFATKLDKQDNIPDSPIRITVPNEDELELKE